jgi:hypothetical protein
MERSDGPGSPPEFQGFSDRQGDRFLVSVPDGVVELTLIEATVLPTRVNAARREPFSVVFLGQRDCRLTQGTHTFEHEELGSFEMFIVPIAPVEQGPRYEAIFN